MCSPYLTGSLAVMLVLVTFNYWSASTQNSDLVAEVQQMTRQMKLSSERVVKLETSLSDCRGEGQRNKGARDNLEAKALRLEEEKKQVEDLSESLKKSLQTRVEELEKDVSSHQEEKKEYEISKNGMKKELLEAQANITSTSVQVSQLRNSSWQLANCLAGLANERAEKLVKPLGLSGKTLQRGESGGLGEGQLPDVNINAVEVVKKNTLGHNGLVLEPLGMEKYPGRSDRVQESLGEKYPGRGSSKGPGVMALPVVGRGISSTSSVAPGPREGGGVVPPPLAALLHQPPALNPDQAEDDSQVPQAVDEAEDQSPDGEIDETVDVEKQHYLVDQANEVAVSGETAAKEAAAVELSGGDNVNDNLDNLKKSLNEKEDAEEDKKE